MISLISVASTIAGVAAGAGSGSAGADAVSASFWNEPCGWSPTAPALVTMLVISPPGAERTAGRKGPPPHAIGLTEETEQHRARLVGDRQRLDAKLLLGLQGGQLSAFLAEVGVDQIADAGVERVLQVLHEGQLVLQGGRAGAEHAQRAVHL